MSGIADDVQMKLQRKRSDLYAALAKIVSPIDKNRSEDEKKKLLQEIVTGCFNALIPRKEDAESAEAVGELLVRNLIQQSDLGDVQYVLSHIMMQDLTADEVLWLQPRLAKVLADVANGYCRMMRQEALKRRADIHASHVEKIENEARYRALFENAPFDLFSLTLDRRFLKVNQNFQRHWGHFEGRQLQSFKPMALARLLTELCERVVVQQKTLELYCRKKNKSACRYSRIILAPIITEEKVIIGFVGLIINTADTAIALDEKKTFAEQLIQISEEERRRISRDIHDSLGQSLFALQLNISAVKSNLHNEVAQAREILENSEALLSALIKETSALCHRLRPRLLDDFGIVEALDDLVENIEMTGALHIDFEKKWLAHKKNKSLETALYRVSQEGLANVLKHSHASHVKMRLHKNDDCISLSIHDDGRGFDLSSVLNSRRKGFGLMNMKERIDLIGGTFNLQTAPNEGTKIDITVPSRTKD